MQILQELTIFSEKKTRTPLMAMLIVVSFWNGRHRASRKGSIAVQILKDVLISETEPQEYSQTYLLLRFSLLGGRSPGLLDYR